MPTPSDIVVPTASMATSKWAAFAPSVAMPVAFTAPPGIKTFMPKLVDTAALDACHALQLMAASPPYSPVASSGTDRPDSAASCDPEAEQSSWMSAARQDLDIAHQRLDQLSADARSAATRGLAEELAEQLFGTFTEPVQEELPSKKRRRVDSSFKSQRSPLLQSREQLRPGLVS